MSAPDILGLGDHGAFVQLCFVAAYAFDCATKLYVLLSQLAATFRLIEAIPDSLQTGWCSQRLSVLNPDLCASHSRRV